MAAAGGQEPGSCWVWRGGQEREPQKELTLGRGKGRRLRGEVLKQGGWYLSGSDGKESACSAGDLDSILGVGKIPWRREWQPTLVFLPGEFHGQRSLVGYSPWGCKESDMTERLSLT